MLHPDELYPTRQGVGVTGDLNESGLKRLVYFQKYSLNGNTFDTLQHELESTCVKTGSQNRQSTRYSVHGLHEYRGKFNPQIVRAILNFLDIPPGSTVIDPFCGSGTTLVECLHGDIRALGFDMNPMAVFISNAKLQALSVKSNVLSDYLKEIIETFQISHEKRPFQIGDSLREKYLQKWFNQDILLDIEYLKRIIEDLTGSYKNIFLALVSDFLREYSLQEPFDLRIRRRKTPLPKKPLIDEFNQKATIFIENLRLTQKVVGVKEEPIFAYLCDSREIITQIDNEVFTPSYHAAITSPPYATALPYIDTQRLSLIWLELIDPKELKTLEAELTGSREFTNKQKLKFGEGLYNNREQLTTEVHEYCQMLKNAVSKNDGFRRQAVPSLMYRYFTDMQDVFKNVLNLVKSNAPFALVVGHNHTTLGEQRFDIDTPDLLKEVAISCGWNHQESIPLQTYHRYSMHSVNAVRVETLLILRKP